MTLTAISLFAANVSSWLPDLPLTAALGAVALLGYIVGKRGRPSSVESVRRAAKRELQRARAVADELERILRSIRSDVCMHEGSLLRFKTRVRQLADQHDDEACKALCREAEEVLRPTLQLASQIAYAYDQIRHQMHYLLSFSEVRTDQLTGVRNRRGLDEGLDCMFAMRARYAQQFCVAILDIDGFKQINDSQGHIQGDRVLQELASMLDEAVRATDMVARYGGEEFVVLMPATGIQGAGQLAERLRRTVDETKIAGEKLTISGGVTLAVDDDDIQSLMTRADEALYRAKDAGRNCIYVHDGDEIEPVDAAAIVCGAWDETALVANA